ncbi:MAG: hypothetical protein ACYCS7_03925 [Acidimicrobiales bacterium]
MTHRAVAAVLSAGGAFARTPRRVLISRAVVIANIVLTYGLVLWHEPSHFCLVAAITLATAIGSLRTLADVLRAHIRILTTFATAALVIGMATAVIVFLLGAATNEAGYLKLGIALMVVTAAAFALLYALATLVEAAFNLLCPQATIPTRAEVQVPTAADARAEAEGLIRTAYLDWKGETP